MRISDTLVGAGFAGAGALVVAATLTYPPMEGGQPGPALFPRIVGGLMAALGVALAVRGLREGAAGPRVAWGRVLRSTGFVNALFVIAAVAAYIALADRLGFLLTGAAILFVLMWRLEVGARRAAVVAVLFTAFVHLLFFKVLRVPLPTGILWW